MEERDLFERVFPGPTDNDVVLWSYADVSVDPRSDSADEGRLDPVARCVSAEVDWTEIGRLSPSARRALVEQGVASSGFSQFSPGRLGLPRQGRVVMTAGDRFAVRAFRVDGGNRPGDLARDCALALELVFGQSGDGFDMAAFRAGVALCLPASEQAGMLETVARKALDLGFQVSAFASDTERTRGSIYLVEAESGFEDGFRALENAAELLAGFERRVRIDLADRQPLEVEDRIRRALAIAKEAALVDADEGESILASLRLGMALGKIAGGSSEELAAMWKASRIMELESGSREAKTAAEERARLFGRCSRSLSIACRR